jgi:hypothetical protein
VICAGYPDEMGVFVDSNPGLRSRFPKTIAFPDYSTDELLQIFASQCKSGGYTPTKEAEAAARAWLDAVPRDKGFGNGRLVRNLFEAAMAAQASRIVSTKEASPSNEELVALTPEDIAAATAP